jgi:hypothetical protein
MELDDYEHFYYKALNRSGQLKYTHRKHCPMKSPAKGHPNSIFLQKTPGQAYLNAMPYLPQDGLELT